MRYNNATAMRFRNLAHNREAKSRSVRPAGREGFEQMLSNVQWHSSP